MIINKWTKLSTFNVNDFFTNINKVLEISVNVVQRETDGRTVYLKFFPTMLKTKISTDNTHSDNESDIYI